MAEYKLTYFNSKGVAEPIRFLLAYGGLKYEDKRVEHAEWPEIKKNYTWGQLPVLEVGNEQIAQSSAICRYLGRKLKLNGSTDLEAAKIDELADAVADFRAGWTPVARESDEEKKAELMKTLKETNLPKFYGNLEAQIEKNGGTPYLVGKSLTWIDLMIAHYVFLIEDTTVPGACEKYPKLKNLQKTVFEIPQIKEWVAKRPETKF